MSPLGPESGVDQRYLREAEGYLELNLPDLAWRSLAIVRERQKGTFEWNLLAGEANRALEKYEAAAGFLEIARMLKPQETGIYVGLGWCYKRMDQLSKAIDALRVAEKVCREQSEAKSETHALVMYNLSCYFALAGKKQESIAWLSRALEISARYRKLVDKETDFDSLRSEPEFRKLLSSFPPADE